MASDRDKRALFLDLGYGGDPAPYERALEEAGLSRPAKARIALAKVPAAEAALAERFVRVCNRGDCRADAAGDGREAAPASAPDRCDLCGGSVNARAFEEMLEACAAAGWRRLCVVGGSPRSHEALRALADGRVEMRLVDGTRARTLAAAKADIAWADRVILWGGTMLGHKVSELYRGDRVIAVARRGAAALVRALAESARREAEEVS